MLTYIIRRLLAMPFLLLGVASLAFCLSHLTQADPLAALVSERQMNNPEVIAAAKERWGLDKSLPEQFVIYVTNLVSGDLGVSFRTRRPVLTDISERLPATLELVIAAMIVGTSSGILLGIVAARFRDKPIDYLARFFALFGSTIPVFWSGLLLLYILSVQFSLIPGPGRFDPRGQPPPFVTGMYTVDALIAGDFRGFLTALHYLVLPAFVLGWSVTGILARLVRASMLDVLGQDYILAARAKGAGERRTLFRHALPNAMIPTLTIIGYSFAYLITGAVLTESVFAWPGIGSYAVDSARTLDYPAIIGVSLVGASAFLLSNLVTDVTYAFANPRIKLS
ncbi:peptide ABC transporter permease [Mesorhizobium tianshanense]|uniref:Peptide/nickel transport system permease protein n=1 Tax=Mesorhizobium tianshanense TaxID=39844 RepID=A0A562P2P5_9HYPH|nr:ABC transporter permease [Mesorhizobium tianshanense]TWI38748.1 peptide/nickel transport system permease protein [Mesorhizobium tianshanense]GLS36682.1 peptide ABC transporter permease [Mesorhizobium tianshanense]